MKLVLAISALAGLALAALLIAWQGTGQVVSSLLAIGWYGLALVTLFHLIPLQLTALAWKSVLSGTWDGGWGLFLRSRWIREGVNDLLPVAQIGGEVIGARFLSLHGAPAPVAGAGVAVDLTMEVLAQFLFTLIGLALVLLEGMRGGALGMVVGGIVIAALALTGFVLAQRHGMFLLVERALERLALRFGWGPMTRMAGLHETVRSLYKRRRNLARSCGLHLLSWIIGSLEIWLALNFMGHPLAPIDTLVLESLGQAVKSAGFIVPGALGVQEGSLMVFGGMLGLSPEVALALSLVKRVRGMLLGIPALLWWQFLESQRLADLFRGVRGEINDS